MCFFLSSSCSITLGGFGADRFYLGQWREGLGKLFSFGGLGIWTLIDVLLIGVGYVGPADGSLYIWSKAPETRLVCALFRFTPCHSQKIEDLRCCVFSMFACPSSLCNTSSSHLLTGRKCFPFTPTMTLPTQPSDQSQSLCVRLLLRLRRWSCARGWGASNYVYLVGLT